MTNLTDLTGINIDEIQEPAAVEEGEYELRLIDCSEVKTNSKGFPFIMPRFEVCDVPTAKDFSHYLGLPCPELDPKSQQRALAGVKKFCLAFGIDLQDFNSCMHSDDFQDLMGEKGWAILAQEDDAKYGLQNSIRTFVIGA